MFSAILSEIAGIEPIFGVFLAGFALNRYIPHSSVLMNRIKFIGNTVFIPFFIIGVGMMVDIKVFFTDINGLIFIFVLIFIAIIAKYIGALIFQKIYSYNVQERKKT